MAKATQKTAHDLIGYTGDKLIRIEGERMGRATYETVGVKDKYDDGPVVLVRVDELADGIKEVTRWVDADTKVELLTRPVGQLIRLGGDMWLDDGKKQYDASGAIVEILSANKKTGVIKAWVRWTVRMTDGEVKTDTVGTLDSSTAKMIFAQDFCDYHRSYDGRCSLVSLTELRQHG